MPKFIDLTMSHHEGMTMNDRDHPRAPLIIVNQRHDITKNFFGDDRERLGKVPLFEGIPEIANDPKKGGHGWQSEHVLIHTHIGAHIDAGLHVDNEAKEDASKIPLARCYGDAIMLDFRELCEKPYGIIIQDIEEAEKKTKSRVKEGDIVIIHTGWAARWAYGSGADRKKYGVVPRPGLALEAPRWFIDRKVKLVGIDTAGLDHDGNPSAHYNFLWRERIGKENISIVENLAYLEKIPQPRFTFIGFPLPIVGGSGSPIRAVAMIE